MIVAGIFVLCSCNSKNGKLELNTKDSLNENVDTVEKMDTVEDFALFYAEQNDSSIELDIEMVEFKGDTLYMEMSGWKDLYFCLPFGEYATMTDFKKHNKWTALFKEVKIKDPIYNYDVFCYCASNTKVCVWKGESSYPKYNAIEPIGITNYISSPHIVLKHNIRVGMSLEELLHKSGYLQSHPYQSFKVVHFYYINNGHHFYLFEDDILVKIVFYDPSILFKEEFEVCK